MHISTTDARRDPSSDSNVQRIRTGKVRTGRRMARRGAWIALVVAAIVALSIVLGAF